MIFKRLLTRKRKPGPSPEDQDSLLLIVRSDEDQAARRDACRLIRRLPELRELAASDGDASVREIALAHYRNLLCVPDGDSPTLTERLGEIGTLEDQRTLEQVAGTAREAEIRQAAIAKVSSPDALARCALHDDLAANRSAAVERIDDKKALEQIVKNIGKKDKRVYRAARQKLKDIVERETLPERTRTKCEELCEKLERLGRFGHWVQDRAMLDLLDRQWAEIEPEADAEWKVRHEELRGRFVAAYEDFRGKHEARIAQEEVLETLRTEGRELIDELTALSALGDEDELRKRFDALGDRWKDLGFLPEKEQSALERKYSASREAATERLEELVARREGNDRLRRLIGTCEKLVDQSKPLIQKQIRGMTDEAKPILNAEGTDKALAARFAELREVLDDRLRKQKKHAEQRLEQLPAKLEELSNAVEGGELKEAEPLYQSILASIELMDSSGIPGKTYAKSAEAARALAPQVRDLQKWRKWGTDQHREGLCVTMEELAETDMPLELMALRLHDLQMEWKGLDKGGSPVNHPLWDRFHAASERVYERCKPFLEEQAAEREASRQRREQLCVELEQFLDQVDWERMDWKKATRAEREMRQAWSEAGVVEGRHRRPLEKRFRAALKRLDGKLAAERGRNQAHKRQLVEQVEALAEAPDLHQAIEETKHLQREWHTTVPARQKEENRIWQRFRAACDAVFARRREEQEAQTVEIKENLRHREAICEEAEKLAESAERPEDLRSGMSTLESRWRDSESLPVPRQASAGLTRRWQEARTRIQHRRREVLGEQQRRSLDLLARQAEVCERLERALVTDGDVDAVLADGQTDWQSLPEQTNRDLQAVIGRRFDAAVSALQNGGEALEALRGTFSANGERRSEMCLHLEILANIDSPPEVAKQRLEFQVTRLKGRMREGDKDPLEARSRLLEEWYLCGPAPVAVASALQERFLRAREAIEKSEPEGRPT